MDLQLVFILATLKKTMFILNKQVNILYNGLKVAVLILFWNSNGKKNKIAIANTIHITPPNLSGTYLKIA
jgi:hypothetical protein